MTWPFSDITVTEFQQGMNLILYTLPIFSCSQSILSTIYHAAAAAAARSAGVAAAAVPSYRSGRRRACMIYSEHLAALQRY